MSYNGWTNYETWNVKLWLDNEEGTQSDMEDMGKRERDEYRLSEQIKSYVLDMMPEIPCSMFSDILNAAMHDVNWQEIAAAYIEDAPEDEDEE